MAKTAIKGLQSREWPANAGNSLSANFVSFDDAFAKILSEERISSYSYKVGFTCGEKKPEEAPTDDEPSVKKIKLQSEPSSILRDLFKETKVEPRLYFQENIHLQRHAPS